MRRGLIAGTALAVLGLAGCASNLPSPEQVRLIPPPGLGLPVSARAMVQIAQPDRDRLFSYDINTTSNEKTDIADGAALERAARAVLGKAFARVATNQPALRPQVVARVTGDAVWDHISGSFRVTCAIDAVEADGTTIGYFPNVYRSVPAAGFASALPRVYAQCLKVPVEHLMGTPEIRAMAEAGFPEPDPVKEDAYLRSQGFVISGR